MQDEEYGADPVGVAPGLASFDADDVAVGHRDPQNDLNQVPLGQEAERGDQLIRLHFKEFSVFLVCRIPSDVVALPVQTHDVNPLDHEQRESDIEAPWD